MKQNLLAVKGMLLPILVKGKYCRRAGKIEAQERVTPSKGVVCVWEKKWVLAGWHGIMRH